jgi:hypothetical protein
MTLLHDIEWEAPLIEPYRDPDAEALMRKKYGFVMDSACPLIVRHCTLVTETRLSVPRIESPNHPAPQVQIAGLQSPNSNCLIFEVDLALSSHRETTTDRSPDTAPAR